MEAPEYYMGAVSASAQFTQEKRFPEQKPGENFTVDDLLDFPNDDTLMTDGFFDSIAVNSTDSSTVTVLDSCCNSSNSNNDPQFSGHFLDSQFSGDLCVPLDEMAELEWLSNFTEDSFSSQELQNLHLISGGGAASTTTVKPESSSSENHSEMARNNTIFNPETPLPGKARSKRSRAAPCDWSTRVLHVPESTMTKTTSSFSKKRENSISNSDGGAGVVRKCLHCAAEKTPQWRTGPMGPKTLCNACGVRYKSGRLVPEYRPAASPTFVSAKHSNSHRKVLELRRQKEFSRHQPQQQHHHHQQQQHMLSHHSSIFGLSNGGNADDYLIHHHHAGSTDFRHLI